MTCGVLVSYRELVKDGEVMETRVVFPSRAWLQGIDDCASLRRQTDQNRVAVVSPLLRVRAERNIAILPQAFPEMVENASRVVDTITDQDAQQDAGLWERLYGQSNRVFCGELGGVATHFKVMR
jgi:hypothetical protein